MLLEIKKLFEDKLSSFKLILIILICVGLFKKTSTNSILLICLVNFIVFFIFNKNLVLILFLSILINYFVFSSWMVESFSEEMDENIRNLNDIFVNKNKEDEELKSQDNNLNEILNKTVSTKSS